MNLARFFTRSSLVSAVPVACAIALCGAGLASGGLITNGNFEANGGYINARFGPLPPTGLPGLPVPTDWTTLKSDVAAAIIGIDFGADGAGLYNLPSHAAALYSTGGISQSFATVAASNYTLSFDAGGWAFRGIPNLPALMTVTLFDGAAPLASTSYVEKATIPTSLEAHSLGFEASSGTTRIEFSFFYNDPLYDGRYFALLDNVVVSDAAVATPEPTSWLLLLLGIGLIGIRAVAALPGACHQRF
jgi:PEP-CTERM motif